MVGTTISHYKVLEKIGQGGMGTVYRAQDTTLDREVAIKVLPEQFTQDPQRLARFEREAKLLASLNHPNIAAIHSFEHSDSMHFLVLELVPGETLAERVAKGPLPVEEALEVCRQIAEGVEAAHEKGVIHRDLKPANVKVTPEGKVKILDFGLAKAFEAEPPVTDISQSPTLTEEMTRAGVILGTAAYMSPEQARGKPVDKRADVFAFGAVLYELLTGKRAFEGETITETIAKVLESEPKWEVLPQNTPWTIRSLLRRCLTKDPHDRLDGIANVRIEIKLALGEPTTVSPIEGLSAAKPALWKRAIPLVLASLVVGISITLIAVWVLTPPPPPHPLTRMAMVLPPTQQLTASGHPVAFSPDGKDLVYVANEQLYLRGMDQLEAMPIRGTEAARGPFFSPDGQWVGFWDGGELKKVSISGGAPVTLCETLGFWGANWGADDVIVFGQGPDGIFQVPANGGRRELLIEMDSEKGEQAYGPQILLGGKSVLFTLRSGGAGWNDAQILVQSLQTGERKVLISGGRDARYVPTGHLVYSHEETLLAVPFDLSRLEVIGASVPILEGVGAAPNLGGGSAYFSFSNRGSLVYVPAIGAAKRALVWVDRQGDEEPLAVRPGRYQSPQLSPNGQRLAIQVNDPGNNDVWIHDLVRGTSSRLTFDPAPDSSPLWTPDGQRVVFRLDRNGSVGDLFWKAADGTGQVERLTKSPNPQIPHSFSPDGKHLLFSGPNPETLWDMGVVSMEGEPAWEPLLQTDFSEAHPKISPDGRWMVYDSDESGRTEVYVRPFPNVEDGKWQISNGGGTVPVWGPKDQELFYLKGDAMMVVRYETEPTFSVGNPKVLFTGRYITDPGQQYDISPDGQKFLMMKAAEQTEASAPHELIIILNWFEELKRLVPRGN